MHGDVLVMMKQGHVGHVSHSVDVSSQNAHIVFIHAAPFHLSSHATLTSQSHEAQSEPTKPMEPNIL